MRKVYPPHPPPEPHWPDYAKRLYVEGCRRIDISRLQFDEDGVLPMPFWCYNCAKQSDEFALVTGDGCPVCVPCVEGMTRILNFDPAAT